MGIFDFLRGKKSSPTSAASSGASSRMSKFARNIECKMCGQRHLVKRWRVNGDRVPFHYESKPGYYSVEVYCAKFNQEWYVVWDDDPGPFEVVSGAQFDSIVDAVQSLPGVILDDWGRLNDGRYGPWGPKNANYVVEPDSAQGAIDFITERHQRDDRLLPIYWTSHNDHVVADLLSKHTGRLLFRFVVLRNATTSKWHVFSAAYE